MPWIPEMKVRANASLGKWEQSTVRHGFNTVSFKRERRTKWHNHQNSHAPKRRQNCWFEPCDLEMLFHYLFAVVHAEAFWRAGLERSTLILRSACQAVEPCWFSKNYINGVQISMSRWKAMSGIIFARNWYSLWITRRVHALCSNTID